MTEKLILVVEDGTEYVDALRRLTPPGDVAFLRAGDAAEARRILGERRVDAVLLDVVFDRTPPERLCGDPRASRHRLLEQQGFYIAAEVAPQLPAGARILIAYDFSSEPDRLAALRERVPALEGVAEGTPLSRVLERLIE